MKLKSKYGNMVEITENKRKIAHLKSMGYIEVEEPIQPKAGNKANKSKNNNTTKRKVKTNEQEN